MALSMFLRNAGYINRTAAQQAMRLSSPNVVVQRAFTGCTARNILARDLQSKNSILNLVRSFKTTPVARSADHSRLWIAEKAISVALLPLIPLALAFPSKLLDYVTGILVSAHIFWGLEACVVDYIRPIIFGNVIPKVALGALYALTICSLGGLFYLINRDIGIAGSIRRIWSIKPANKH